MKRWNVVVNLAIILAGLVGGVYATAEESTGLEAKVGTIELAIGSGSGRVNDTVRIPVAITTNGTAPAVIVFSVAYNQSKLSVAPSGAVQAGSAVTAAGKDVYYAASLGTLVIVIAGGLAAVGDGALVGVDFKITAPATVGDILSLQGTGGSGATVDAVLVPVGFTNGQIEVTQAAGCTVPAAPTGISATDGVYGDRVRITWSAVPGATEYRVYRNTVNVASGAAPVSPWISDTAFSDLTAAASIMPTGCSGGSSSVYYYWVRARNHCGESDLSVSDSGYRGATKALVALPAKRLPVAVPGQTAAATTSDGAMCVHLVSDEPIDPNAVWYSVCGMGDTEAEWTPTDDGGWIVCRPVENWPTEGAIVITAGAATVSGRPVPPAAGIFTMEAPGATSGSDVLEAADSAGASVWPFGGDSLILAFAAMAVLTAGRSRRGRPTPR